MTNGAFPLPLPTQLRGTLLPPTSRYHGLEILKHAEPDGTNTAYLARRFVPSPDRFVLLRWHTVNQGERLDNLAFQYIGDAERFWQIADANNASNPFELTDTVGGTVRITLPEGIPGAPPNA